MSGRTKTLMLDGCPFDIACGQIGIGNTETPMAGRMKKGVMQANGTITPEPTFDVKHVAAAGLYMANRPLDANIPTITVMAAQRP